MSDYSEIMVLLDRSGSMQDAKSDHEGGLNSFIEDQKTLSGDVKFTLIQFDAHDPCEVVYDGASLADVGEYKLVPRSSTPLLDAVGMAIAHLAKRLDGKNPDQVVVMIITDGHENASREYTKERVKDMVKEYEDQHEWKFLFLGANMDAFAEAGAMGVRTSADFANAPDQVAAMYAAVSSNTKKSRHKLQAGMSKHEAYADYDFTESQMQAMAPDTSAAPKPDTKA